jgi:hypothetical protein
VAKSNLPKDVQKVKSILAQHPDDELFEVAQKLMDETPERISMWKTLERRNIDDGDELWVWVFLKQALMASTLPPYHYVSGSERKSLSFQIENLSEELSWTLRANGLDFHIVYNEGTMFNGFYFFEDFSESNQARFEDSGRQKLRASEFLNYLAERCCEIIEEEPLPGKSGKNVKAIRFIRIMAKKNRRFYSTPLNKVIATAANSIFETQYSASDIRKLLSR